MYQPAGELSDRMESAYIELKRYFAGSLSAGESIEFNPTRLDEVNDRQNLIYSLQQKHRVQTLEELMAWQTNIAVSCPRSPLMMIA